MPDSFKIDKTDSKEYDDNGLKVGRFGGGSLSNLITVSKTQFLTRLIPNTH